MKPIPLEEQEYRRSLVRIERAAVVPAKWFVFFVSAGLWFVLLQDRLALPLLIVFGVYGALNLLETLWLYGREVAPAKVRPLVFSSYAIDIAYVVTLIYLDTATRYLGETPHSSFYILCFLLVMRGFALFKTMAGAILINVLISFLFVLVVRLQQANFAFVVEPEFAVQLILIWLVILMAWYIMLVYSEHKIDAARVHEQLTRAEHLGRVGELAAGVAHEINNPLGIIISTSEYLKKTMPADDPLQEDVESIFQESNRCKDIVGQLLAYARPKPATVSRVGLAALDDEVLGLVFPGGRSGKIEVEKRRDGDVPAIQCDSNLLKQALLNLYLNARQAIPKGEEGRVVSKISTTRDRVILEIEDNGGGIAEEDLPRVFDPFFTRREDGVGLGLAMTQRIVESAQGTVELESVSPRGTRARLTFPVVRD